MAGVDLGGSATGRGELGGDATERECYSECY